ARGPPLGGDGPLERVEYSSAATTADASHGISHRARFLREGQLAASLNHPHTVYILGSEEIAGTPAIVMELLPGGTLKKRVKEHGPLPPTEAVDAILQTAGLDAMH